MIIVLRKKVSCRLKVHVDTFQGFSSLWFLKETKVPGQYLGWLVLWPLASLRSSLVQAGQPCQWDIRPWPSVVSAEHVRRVPRTCEGMSAKTGDWSVRALNLWHIPWHRYCHIHIYIHIFVMYIYLWYITHIRMRQYWVRLGLNPMTGVLIRR